MPLPSPPPVLAAGELTLTALTVDDWPLEQALSRVPDVPRWTSYPADLDESGARTLAERKVRRALEGPTCRFVLRSPDGTALGTCGIGLLDQDVPDIGYSLLPVARGRGAATAAVRALTTWALETGAPTVSLTMLEGNDASARVAERSGFTRVERVDLEHRGEPVTAHRWLSRVPRLLLLNGLPGVGKSTLARRYSDAHTGVLVLDVDEVRQLVGGWREHSGLAAHLSRNLALGMVETHLRGGRDVVLPQYLGLSAQLERFEAAAHRGAGRLVEVLLVDGSGDPAEPYGRFTRRTGDRDGWHAVAAALVAEAGGADELRRMQDRLDAVLADRPDTHVVSTRWGAEEAAYAALLDVLPR